jgi:hypothetical protein
MAWMVWVLVDSFYQWSSVVGLVKQKHIWEEQVNSKHLLWNRNEQFRAHALHFVPEMHRFLPGLSMTDKQTT